MNENKGKSLREHLLQQLRYAVESIAEGTTGDAKFFLWKLGKLLEPDANGYYGEMASEGPFIEDAPREEWPGIRYLILEARTIMRNGERGIAAGKISSILRALEDKNWFFFPSVEKE